jgi:hypothetical protein
MQAKRAAATIVLTFSLCLARPILAEEPPAQTRAEVLVLGTYHMNNPGRDIFNTQADDVLAPKRQTEIAQVVAALARFKPTKIAIESDVSSDRAPKQYAEYLAGTHELTRSETEQIGFRLAKMLGHKTIYPVNTDGEFPFARLVKFAKATGREKELDALQAEVGAMVKAQNEYLASHSVLNMLVYMNADERVAEHVGFYFRQAELGEPWDWAGADLVADWFRRNMRIYSNVTGLIESPNERVLVIYGAGHLGWLQYAFASNPKLRLRKLAEFVQ